MSHWPDQSGNRLKQSYIQGFLDISGGNLTIRNNNQLLVGGDTTINGNLLVKKDSYLQGNITLGINTPTTIQYEFESDLLSSVNNSVQCIPAPNFFTSTTLDTSTNIPVGYQTDSLNFKNGTYVTSGSSYFDSNTQPFYAFNGSTNDAWQSSSNLYAANGIYSGDQKSLIMDTTTISGEWIQIELPYSVILNSFYLNATSGAPNLFYVMGSNTSNIWNILYTSSNPSYPLNGYVTIPTNIQPYKYFRLVVNSTTPSVINTHTSVQQWDLYGVPYRSNVSGSDSYIITNVLYNYGVSNSYDGLLSSDALINTNNFVLGKSSLSLNGTNNYLVLPKINVSNSGLSFSLWVYPNTNTDSTLIELNNYISKIAIRLVSNTNTIQLVNGANTFGSSVQLNSTAWTHMVWTITYVLGGTAIHNLYINGVLSYSATDSYPSIRDYYVNYLGRSNANATGYFNGNIDGFRVYNSTLNIYEINALYNMTGTISINNLQSYSFGNHYFSNNVNILKNVYIGNDVSLNGKLFLNSGNIWTNATNANLYTTSSNVFIGANTGQTAIQNDVSMNGNLFITNDISLNGKLFLNSGNIWTTATNANLYTTSANVFIGANTGKTTIQNDTAMNGNLFITNDVSLNGNLFVNSGNIWTTATNANLYTTSANVFIGANTGKTTIQNDTAVNGNLFVTNDISLNGKLFLNSGNIWTTAINSNLYTTSANVFIGANTGKTAIQNDVSMNGNLFVTNDISLNGKLFVNSGNIWTTATNANLYTTSANVFIGNSTGRTTIQNDTAMNGNLFVANDISLNGNMTVSGYLYSGAPLPYKYSTYIDTNTTLPANTPNLQHIKLVGSTAFTLTLPNPYERIGITLFIWNNNSNDCSLNAGNQDATTPSDFNGCGKSTNNITIKKGSQMIVQNDGSDWLVLTDSSYFLNQESLNNLINAGSVSSFSRTDLNAAMSDFGPNSISTSGNLIVNTEGNLIVNGNVSGNGFNRFLTSTLLSSLSSNSISTSGNITVTGTGNISAGSGGISTSGNITGGNIFASSFNATSDYRIKIDIRKLSNESIDTLKPVRYYNTLSQKEDIGLIAHELQEEYPFLVNGIKDGDNYQSVNYTGMIGLLIKEVQELKKTVVHLQNQINQLSS